MIKLFPFLTGAMLLIAPATANAELVTALTSNNSLVNFDTATPGTTSSVGITGLVGGDVLGGIDSRPLNGVLYGFAVNGSTGRLYSINTTTGQASVSSVLDQPVSGNFFGVDFNPTVDRLRIVSDTGQNLRVNVDSGLTTIDGNLQFAASDPNAGTPPQVVAAAYSNNVASAASTTLYTLDLSTQSLLTQFPPNNGTLNTVASLSNIIFPEAAFDISGITGVAYAILNGFELSQINLVTGEAMSLGAINSPGNIIGLAAGVTAVPEPSSAVLTALVLGAGYLVRRRRKAIVPSDEGAAVV